MTAKGRSWHVIVEHDAPHSPYVEGLAEVPGVGDCVRDDGRAGPLVELVPEGWRLIDSAHVIITNLGGRERVYVACADGVVVTQEHFSPSRRWRAESGRLLPDEPS